MQIQHSFFLMAALYAGPPAAAQPLRILTTEVAPMAFVKDGTVQGFCVEIVAQIERRLGLPASTMSVLPWARAYYMGQTEPNIMLVCPKRTSVREQYFHWVGPLLASRTLLYSLAGTHGHIAALSDAKKLPRILVVRASYSYQDLTAKGFRNLHEVNDASAMVRMLMAGRAPAMMLEQQELSAVLSALGIDAGAFSAILDLPSPTSNLAFSRDVPLRTVAQWQGAFEAMKKDGSYGKMYDKWFPARAPLR